MTRQQAFQRNIPLIYGADFLNALLFIIPVWVAFYRQYLSFTQISLMTSVAIAIGIVFEMPTGAVADFFGRKKSIALGMMVYAFGACLIGFAHNGWMIIAGALINGIGNTFISGASTAVLYETLKEVGEEKQFAKIRSNDVLINQLGIILSSVFAGYLYAMWQGLPFVLTGITSAFGGLLYLFMQEPTIEKEKFTVKNFALQHVRGLHEAFKTRYLTNLSLFYGLVGGITWGWQTYFTQIYATSIGYSEIGKSWLFAIIRLVNSIIIIRLLHFDKHLTRKNMFLFFPLIILFSALFAPLPSHALGTVLLFTMTMSSTIRFIVLDKYVNEEFSSKYRATTLSALNMFVSLVQIAILAISGPLLDHFSAGFVYFCMGIFALVTILPQGVYLSRHQESKIK
jgi:MFS family permease